MIGIHQEATTLEQLPCHLVVFGLHVEVHQQVHKVSWHELLRLLLGCLKLKFQGFKNLIDGLLCLLELARAHVNSTHVDKVNDSALHWASLSQTACQVVNFETSLWRIEAGAIFQALHGLLMMS
jgi:hypothetical protein